MARNYVASSLASKSLQQSMVQPFSPSLDFKLSIISQSIQNFVLTDRERVEGSYCLECMSLKGRSFSLISKSSVRSKQEMWKIRESTFWLEQNNFYFLSLSCYCVCIEFNSAALSGFRWALVRMFKLFDLFTAWIRCWGCWGESDGRGELPQVIVTMCHWQDDTVLDDWCH